MGPATIGYMIGAFVGALFFTGIVVAVSRSIRSSLTKLFVAVAVLTVLSIVAEYYGSADGAPIEFPPPLGWFLGFEASLRLATFGAAFLVFSVPVLTGFWKRPSEAQETFGTSNLRMSHLAIPIALASFVPLGWFLYENRPPESGLELYGEIAPRTLALLDDINPTFRSQAEEAIGVHRLSSGVFDPQSVSEFRAEVEIVAMEVHSLLVGRGETVLRAPAEVQADVLRAMADGIEWFAVNQSNLCTDFLIQGWGPFADTFAPESHVLLDEQIRAMVNAALPGWTGQPTPTVEDDDLTHVGHVWATKTAPSLGYSREQAISAAESFDKTLAGEPDGNCQGVADILRMIASEGDPEIVRIRAALAQAYSTSQ